LAQVISQRALSARSRKAGIGDNLKMKYYIFCANNTRWNFELYEAFENTY
jgi:hypothetical protein